MKELNDILNESLLDDENEIMDSGVKAAQLREIWEDMAVNWGEVLMGSARKKVTIDNIDLDSKGRIIFKNWPGNEVQLYFGQIGFIPESFKRHGFGSLPNKIEYVTIHQYRGKLSDLRLEGSYKNKKLILTQGSYEMDKFPSFSEVYFDDTYFKNTHILPKKQPKNCVVKFSNSSVEHLFSSWSDHFFKGSYPQWTRDGQQIVM